MAFPFNSRNYFSLANLSTDAAAAPIVAPAVSPSEARSIDEKLDDERPLSGAVLAVETNLSTLATPAATGPCASNAAGTPYFTNTVAADAIGCALIIRTSF
jgi:hypothetical protein